MPKGIYQRTEEHKIKLGLIRKGKKVSKETKLKMGLVHKKWYTEHPEKTLLRNEKVSQALKGRKLSEEQKRKISEANKGKKAWNKGLTKETDERIKKYGESGSLARKGRKVSEETRKNMSLANKGDKSYLWKGGITKLNHQIRDSFENRLWVRYCMERDDFTCQNCEIIGGELEVHHMKAFSKIIQENNIKSFDDARKCAELWDLENGITLCKGCHKKLKENY